MQKGCYWMHLIYLHFYWRVLTFMFSFSLFRSNKTISLFWQNGKFVCSFFAGATTEVESVLTGTHRIRVDFIVAKLVLVQLLCQSLQDSAIPRSRNFDLSGELSGITSIWRCEISGKSTFHFIFWAQNSGRSGENTIALFECKLCITCF